MSSKNLKELAGVGAGRCVSPSPSDDENVSLASPKRGRKESEQRRRIMMNQYFDELIALLSMLSERCIPKKMDKATTLHEAVQCIQIYSDLTSKPDRTLTLDTGRSTKSSKAPKSPSPTQTDVLPEGTTQGLHTVGELLHFFLDSHDAFLMVISDSGRVLYSTELITSLLGHMQTRLVGQNFFDFVLENDHPLFQKLLKLDQSGIEGLKLKDRPIIAYPPKLIQCHLKLYSGETGYFPQYLQFKAVVYLRKWDTERSKLPDMNPASPDPSSSESGFSGDAENQTCLVMIGKLPASLSMVDLPVGTNDVNFEFEMRISREGRIIDIDKHAATVLGYTTSEIIGTSFFDYIDPYHLLDVSEGMSTFLSSGLGTTTPYRLQTKGGRSIWLISKGYLSYNPWNNKPDHILLSNRVLGCDQVLPEHRFFRSRKLLPDVEGHECYAPDIPVSRSSPPPPSPPLVTTHSTGISTPDSGVLCNRTEGHINSVSNLNTAQHQQPQQQQQQQQLLQPQSQPQMQSFQTQSHLANTQQSSSMQQPLPPPQQGVGGGIGGQTPQSTPMAPGPSPIQTPVTPTPLQRIGSASTLPSTASSGMLQSAPGPPPAVASIQNFEDIQRELDRKNREIFEMQKKLFEQQKLFEQERNQFYSITAQVMQCITSSAINNQIPPNMQMIFSTSGDYNSPSVMNTQSKVMDSPLQSTQRDPYSGGSVPTVSVAPLWDTSAQQMSMDNFSNSTTQYAPLQQGHPQQHHHQQAPQQHHQQVSQQHHQQAPQQHHQQAPQQHHQQAPQQHHKQALQQHHQQAPQQHHNQQALQQHHQQAPQQHHQQASQQHQQAPQQHHQQAPQQHHQQAPQQHHNQQAPQQHHQQASQQHHQQVPQQHHHQQHHQQALQQQQQVQAHTQHQRQQHQIQSLPQLPYVTTPATSMPPVSSVNFTTVSEFMPVTSSNVTSRSGMLGSQPDHPSGDILSEQFGLSQAFKMSRHQSLAEHNLQFFHQQIPPHQQQQHSGTGGQNTGHLAPPGSTQSPAGDFGGLISNDVLSNLTSPSGSTLNLSTLPIGMQHSQKTQQHGLPSENLADILNSARFS